MQSKSDLLLNSLNLFYDNNNNADMFKSVVMNSNKREGHVSLRTIEKFITNFSKNTNFTFNSGGQKFPVHVRYKSTLDGYSKKLFDPFARYEKIEYTIPATGEVVTTTVGQLKFLRWAIKNNIISYIKQNPNVMKAT